MEGLTFGVGISMSGESIWVADGVGTVSRGV